jgi:uncharacterized protein YbjT (DUF2867 family)
MKTLVIGGTGSVGKLVVAGLIGKGTTDIRVLTRSADHAKVLPAKVEVVVGDLDDPASARGAFEGIDAVFVLNPVSRTEANEGIVAVSLARAAKAKRLVYMSVQGVDKAPYLPHFGSKDGVEAAVRASGNPYTILQPNNFFQNDVWLKDVIMGFGLYAQPIGNRGLHRVDTRDIADAAVNALTQSGFENKTYVLAGPAVVNGTSTAEIWTSKMGKKVTYAGDDLDGWEKQASAMMPGWMLYDMKMRYRHFQENGLIATANELAECQKIVGHAGRTFDAFAAECASAWKK